MKKFKYIILEGCYPVLFTEADKHVDRAGASRHLVTSAGFGELFIDLEGELTVRCWGESVSLNIKCDPLLDKHLILRMFKS